MKRKVIVAFVVFTVFVCILYVYNNPIILTHIESEKFTEGEVFVPFNGEYDFKTFKLNSSAFNYTVKFAYKGHVQLVDDTGNITINVLQWDKINNIERFYRKAFIDSELRKPSWTVDGVNVHEIEFRQGDLYSAAVKDTDRDTWIYIAAPDEAETAKMITSLRFD
ncbi:MAG: hypothetical protein IJ258_01655 [Methanobrevibacter sp.]|uniref:hypothetical protein n=1 Tax=Methanobrevibacter sp. TaxID=66852 RepID=UPI0025DAD15E|nr:hypothetical protein [Methanobrevibacter sp.]MBQ8016789.1 hypothetical protein [Methanobrevibacter sp.]